MNTEKPTPIELSELDNKHSLQKKNGKTVAVLFMVAIGMFGVGFAMVPIYRLVCNITGLNGAADTRVVDTEYVSAKNVSGVSRTVKVEFDSTLNQELEFEFFPKEKSMEVQTGEAYETIYYVKNKTDRQIIAQAVPGITPWQASKHFDKTECFCFTQQTLEPGEFREMPLKFVVNASLPETINTLTLSYTFMDTNRDNLKNKKFELSFQAN